MGQFWICQRSEEGECPRNASITLACFLQHRSLEFLSCVIQDKPAVLSLQNLIVRDIANQERGMFLIIDSSPPVMYEFHATSKENKNVWMRHIQHAVGR